MWNLKLIIITAILVIFTLFVAVSKPKMHKQLVINDSMFEIEQSESVYKPVKIENKNIKIDPYQFETKNSSVQFYSQPQIQQRPKSVSEQYNQVKQQSIQQTSKPQSLMNKTVKTKPVTEQAAIKQEAKKEELATQPVKTAKPLLTEQEEIIAWNKWRSRLQNQVMMDSKVAAPLGTQFKFSFTVDKYGNMSNVKVWCVSPAYNEYAVRVIKPVLMSYRNKPILNFPEGTKRIVTNVDGGFVISRYTQYSSPSDYHDFERVKK